MLLIATIFSNYGAQAIDSGVMSQL